LIIYQYFVSNLNYLLLMLQKTQSELNTIYLSKSAHLSGFLNVNIYSRYYTASL